MGALNGVSYSNSYMYEKLFDWRGLLIEGHPTNSRALRNNTGDCGQRTSVASVTASVCGSGPYDTLGTLDFTSSGGATGAAVELASEEYLNGWHGGRDNAALNTFTVDCIPLQSLLDATGLIDIDLFSLDVEGSELAVLQTVDWAVTNIHVLLVEQDGTNPAKDEAVRALMTKHGYVLNPFGKSSDACVPGEDCADNDVFVNPHYTEVKKARDAAGRRYYHYGTGIRCAN